MDQKLFEEKLARMGIELRGYARRGPRMGQRKAVFPEKRSCRWTLRSDNASTEKLQEKCKCTKNYYYSQLHILMRCEGCKQRRHIQFKLPKKT